MVDHIDFGWATMGRPHRRPLNFSEALREGDMTFWRKILSSKNQNEMFEQPLPDSRDRLVIQSRRLIDPFHLGADIGCQTIEHESHLRCRLSLRWNPTLCR